LTHIPNISTEQELDALLPYNISPENLKI